MERISLNSQSREERGKNKVKKLRRENFVPACLYKEGQETKIIKVDKGALYHALHTKAGENVLVDLVTDSKGKKAIPVMIKEVQYHPIKDEVLHVDFHEISLTEEIKVSVPIATKGEAEAVTKENGTVEHIMWEVDIECLPTEIPEKIEIDISALKIGDKIFVKDLTVSPNIKIVNDPELVIVSAEPPHVEKPAEEALEEETTEPELIAKGKKEEGEVAEEAPPKEAKKEEKKE